MTVFSFLLLSKFFKFGDISLYTITKFTMKQSLREIYFFVLEYVYLNMWKKSLTTHPHSPKNLKQKHFFNILKWNIRFNLLQ